MAEFSLDALRQVLFVGIVGSREYPELGRVEKLVGLLAPNATIISGAARGVDTAAATAAFKRGLCVIEVTVDKRLSRERYIETLFRRNTTIVRASDIVVAFWDGTSKGTGDGIAKAVMIHGQCVVVLPGEKPQVFDREHATVAAEYVP